MECTYRKVAMTTAADRVKKGREKDRVQVCSHAQYASQHQCSISRFSLRPEMGCLYPHPPKKKNKQACQEMTGLKLPPHEHMLWSDIILHTPSRSWKGVAPLTQPLSPDPDVLKMHMWMESLVHPDKTERWKLYETPRGEIQESSSKTHTHDHTQ